MVNLTTVTAALTAVSALQPDIAIALAAYSTFKSIWMAITPGKTEADFVAFLQTTSQANIDSTAVYLQAQGYVETTPGNWSKPPAA